VTIVLALLAAFVFAIGVVLQQRVAWQEPEEHAARPRLLWRLARRPLWVLGMGADVIAFGLQAVALHRGSLVVVQPLLTTALLFTLFLTSITTQQPIVLRQWAAVGLVLTGLGVFLADTSPTASHSSGTAGARAWLLCTIAVVVVTALAVSAGLRHSATVRAALFGVAAGMADAFMATLAKAFSDSFGHGIGGVFETWTPYAVVGAGLISLTLISTAYQAGHPTVSLPVITVVDPVVSSLIGLTLFSERLTLGGVRGPLLPVALVAMGMGLVMLGRDDRVAAELAGDHRGAPTVRPA
jgi:drug/metabolite transporter (DMT)-like permease